MIIIEEIVIWVVWLIENPFLDKHFLLPSLLDLNNGIQLRNIKMIHYPEDVHSSLEWTDQEHQHLSHYQSSNHTWWIQLLHITEWIIQLNSFFSEFRKICIEYNPYTYSQFSLFLYLRICGHLLWSEIKKGDLISQSHDSLILFIINEFKSVVSQSPWKTLYPSVMDSSLGRSSLLFFIILTLKNNRMTLLKCFTSNFKTP